MDKNYLRYKLIFPLLGFALLRLFLAYPFAAKDFWLNFAPEIISLLISLLYVDWILDQHEKRRWAFVRLKAHERIERFANFSVGMFRDAFDLGIE